MRAGGTEAAVFCWGMTFGTVAQGHIRNWTVGHE